MNSPYAVRRTIRVDLPNKQAESTLPIHPNHEGATHPLEWIAYL